MSKSTISCDEHEDADGCLCHAPVGLHEATHDRDLPEATGGVEGDLKLKGRRRATRTAVEGDE